MNLQGPADLEAKPWGSGDLSIPGPQVHVVYESRRERDEIVERLRKAGLGEVHRVLIAVDPSDEGEARDGAMARLVRRRRILLAAGIAATGPIFLASLLLWSMMRSGGQQPQPG